MKTYKTADGVSIIIGMEIWVNPDYIFDGSCSRTSFVKKRIVSKIDDKLACPICSHDGEFVHLTCSFSPDTIFFDKEKWATDRKKRYTEVLKEKRKELFDYIEEKTKEINKIECIIDNVDNWISL